MPDLWRAHADRGIWGDCHHLRPRADGGTHDPDNLVYVCPAHHRAAHEGRLVIRGSWSERMRFEHADGTTAHRTRVRTGPSGSRRSARR